MSDHVTVANSGDAPQVDDREPDFLTLPITGEFEGGWLLQFDGRLYLDGLDEDVEQQPIRWIEHRACPNPDHPWHDRLVHRTWVCGAEFLARVRCRLTAPTPRAVPAPQLDPRLALGAAAVLSPTQAAELLPGRESENMRWLRDQGLVRTRPGLPDVVILDDVLEALRSGEPSPDATSKPRPTLRRARIN